MVVMAFLSVASVPRRTRVGSRVLSEALPASLIVGVDVSEACLCAARNLGLSNVALVRGDATAPALRDGCVDTAVFVGSLHEVYSSLGEAGVAGSLKEAYRILGKSGVLVLWDLLKPPPRRIDMGLRNERTRLRFGQFAEEFEPRRVAFEESERGVILDIADAVEFVTKYRSPDPEDWRCEMREMHLPLSMEDYRRVLSEAGFLISALEERCPSDEWWTPIRRDIECDFEAEPIFVLIVAAK